ncbi:hypothetical protein JZ751_014409 [Albula glossodonta]|uniref:Pyrin domain-containing protein n=1 Tax=Albula glossodonta TaxID=121402 RepID=A0A8T2MYT7_9TELE|nr:hypothetical protein JZ751_014409 [Albula glossodonta]
MDELLAEELKRFRWNLTHDVPEGFRPIPKGQLENRDVPDTVHQMLDSYGEEGAVKVTLHVLKTTGQNNLAQKLEKDYMTAETGGNAVEHTGQASTDFRSASLNPSVTAETGGNTVDHTGQAPTDLRSVPYHSFITAQTGASVAAPQVHGCNVAGNMTVNVNIQPDNKATTEAVQDQKSTARKGKNYYSYKV